MEKSKLNYIVDVLMGVAFVIASITGLVVFFFLPSGVKQGRYLEFLGIIKGTWTAWHNWAGIIIIVLVLVHLILHWKWMVNMTKSFFGGKKNG